MVRTQSNDPTFTLKRNVTCQLIYKLTTISLETGTVNSEVTVIDGFAKLLDSVIIFFFTSQLPWRPGLTTLYIVIMRLGGNGTYTEHNICVTRV